MEGCDELAQMLVRGFISRVGESVGLQFSLPRSSGRATCPVKMLTQLRLGYIERRRIEDYGCEQDEGYDVIYGMDSQLRGWKVVSYTYHESQTFGA